MARFELTAKHVMFIGNQCIEKGTQVSFNINHHAVTPSNLFGGSKWKDDVLKGFSDGSNNIKFPPNSMYLSSSHWDIKIK